MSRRTAVTRQHAYSGENDSGDLFVTEHLRCAVPQSPDQVLWVIDRRLPFFAEEALVSDVDELAFDPCLALEIGAAGAVHHPAVGVVVLCPDEIGHVTRGVTGKQLLLRQLLRLHIGRGTFQAIAIAAIAGAYHGGHRGEPADLQAVVIEIQIARWAGDDVPNVETTGFEPGIEVIDHRVALHQLCAGRMADHDDFFQGGETLAVRQVGNQVVQYLETGNAGAT